MNKWISFIAISLLTVGCNQQINTHNNHQDVLASNIDSSVSPSDDFFLYANGGWIKKNPIPSEQSSWGIGNLVIEENLKRLREISEQSAASKSTAGSDAQKIGDFWITAMDSAKIELDGLKPIQPLLDKINAANDLKSLIGLTAEFKAIGSSTFFSEYVGQDAKQSDVIAYQLWQGGIGLPNREYYFKNDSASVHIRKSYENYIAEILTMSGENASTAAAAASRIIAMETKMAAASRKIEDLRDPYMNYNKLSASDLNQMTGNIDWNYYFSILGIRSIDSVIVGQPEFFKSLNKIIIETSIADLKQYIKFNLVTDLSGVLPEKFGTASFNFSRLFSGATKRKARWKRAIQMEEAAMGEMLGRLYVKEFFNEKAKKRYTDMVESIRQSLKDRIGNLSWMSDSTKQKAYTKLAAMKSKVGYPDKWKDFSSMEIGRESLAQNVMNAKRWWHHYEYNKLGKPVNRDEWDMYPQTYNAYYNPSNNEIVLPAGIFTVPGYRDEELDDAVVYGYAGASTIGHEITHGFDDEGRQFDDKGNLVSWWTKKDEEAFNKRADVMIKQFEAFEPLKGYHINGKATLGENIADMGGILLGIEAFQKTVQYKENKSVSNLTPMQRFFMGYALGWMGHTREEQLRNRLLTDVHSPDKYRVNGPFVNVDAFYSTFDIKPGSPMYRTDSLRVRIW